MTRIIKKITRPLTKRRPYTFLNYFWIAFASGGACAVDGRNWISSPVSLHIRTKNFLFERKYVSGSQTFAAFANFSEPGPTLHTSIKMRPHPFEAKTMKSPAPFWDLSYGYGYPGTHLWPPQPVRWGRNPIGDPRPSKCISTVNISIEMMSDCV